MFVIVFSPLFLRRWSKRVARPGRLSMGAPLLRMGAPLYPGAHRAGAVAPGVGYELASGR